MRRMRLAARWVPALATVLSVVWTALPQQKVSFQRDVLPILSENCLKCHGAAMQMSKLDLRSRAAMLIGGKGGPAIVPGNAEGSRLFRMVTGMEQPRMPFGGAELPAAHVSVLRDWIQQGAVWEGPEIIDSGLKPSSIPGVEEMPITAEARQWWAFRRPTRPRVPRVKNGDWSRHPIDAFLARAFEEKGLAPAPAADKATLVRRAYLDLLGLPPAPDEAASFIADTSPDAWEKLLDRLLASPHYGERWGRHWLDVARYADSSGFEHDRDRPNAWRYRDYVIRSFNQDKPYNVFLKEQIAGDELDATTDETLIATGFLRAGPRVAFREKDNPERRYDYLDDLIATTGRGVLGLTVQCARCHNHKFDPIPQRDYYSLEASFFGYVETTHPLVPRAEAEAYERRVRELDAREAPLKAGIQNIEAPYKERLTKEAYTKFPEHVQRAIAKPEPERTRGERLLAQQVIEHVNIPPSAIDRAMAPDDAAKKKRLAAEIAALEKRRPKPVPVAEIVTEG